MVNLPVLAYPSCWQMTCASVLSHPSLQIVPHTPSWHTSTLPSWSMMPSIKRTAPSSQLPGPTSMCTKWSDCSQLICSGTPLMQTPLGPTQSVLIRGVALFQEVFLIYIRYFWDHLQCLYYSGCLISAGWLQGGVPLYIVVGFSCSYVWYVHVYTSGISSFANSCMPIKCTFS